MPRAVFCEFCGQMFFPASLKIHQKSCRERQSKTIVECPHCLMEMPQAEFDDHLRKCKKAQAARKEALGDGLGADSVCSRLPDGRVACQFCGRGFAANRVAQHAAICGKLKQARPRGRDGTATQVPEKVYDGSTADFAKRESAAAEHRSSSAVGTPKPAAQPSSAKKSPESSRDSRAPHSPSSEARVVAAIQEADPDGWRAKHREFIDAIRSARRTKGGPLEGAEPAQVVRPPDSPARAAPPPPAASARVAHEARLEPDPPPTPPATREKPAAQRQKGGVAKAAVAEDRRRQQRQQLAGPVGDWEATSAAAVAEMSPKSTGREVAAGQSLSPVLRRASAPSSPTATGGSQSAGFPLTPSSRDDRLTPERDEDGEFIDPMGDWIPGDHVQVQGLVNARELNGQVAVLLDFDLDAGCWLVRLENGVVKAMRSEHMTKAQVPSKAPSVAETPEPGLGASRSQSPGSRSAAASVRGPSPPKRLVPKSLRSSTSVGPRRMKASQSPEPANDPAGKRPPKAPRSSSVEPRRSPGESPRPRRNEPVNEVRPGGNRLAESTRGHAGGPGKHGSAASPEDDAPTKEVPVAISRSLKNRRPNEVPRACSKAASVPYISSVPEDACAPQQVPPLEFAQTPKDRVPFRGLGYTAGRSPAKAVASLAGQPEGGSERFPESPPHARRCTSESPRLTNGLPEVLDSPVHPPLDSPLASKGHAVSENTDGIDERQPASEPPLSGRAETASTGAGPRTTSSFDGSSTPLSARGMVPGTIQYPPHGMQGQQAGIAAAGPPGPLWTGPLQGASVGYTPAAASTAPALQVHHPSATYAPLGRHTLTPSWGGAGRAATAAATAPAVASGMEVLSSVRTSTRQLHTPSMTPSQTPMGPAPGQFMAPHPPASLCLFGGSAQYASAQQLQPQACAVGPPAAVQQPHPLSSPVMRTQPRRAA